MAKTLVTYFSAGGVTKKAAERLAIAAKADIYEIRAAVPYTMADLNWMDRKSRSSVEMNDPSSRPEIVKADLDLSSYDTILLGFPIWWYTAPMIIRTFLESYDFSGKKIVLFATSGGSGFGNTAQDLKPSAPGAEIIEGKLINRAPDKMIEAFAASISEEA